MCLIPILNELFEEKNNPFFSICFQQFIKKNQITAKYDAL
jgi:hypothetical protein